MAISGSDCFFNFHLNFNTEGAEVKKIFTLIAFLLPILATFTYAADLPPCTRLVYPGIDGKLVYVPDEQGNIIPDYSHAGYGGGGVALP